MKINEKNLVSFALSQSTVDREGWLQKRGEVNRAYQRRWFLLKGNLLFYFEKKTDREPLGVVILEGCTVELAENEETFAFKVVFHGSGNRMYMLSADTQESMEAWMKALACAPYDYMKLMVAELQRQLSQVAEAERLAKCGNTVPLLIGGKLPGNRSDSCLCVRDTSSGRAARFNPFDRWKEDGCGASDSAEVPKSSGGIAASTPASSRSSTKYTFTELHRRHGIRFRKLIEERKRKEEKERGLDLLIDL